MFKKQIRDRFKDINKVELPGGFKATLAEAKVEAVIEEVTAEADPKDIEQKQYISDQLRKLIDESVITKSQSIYTEPILNKIIETDIGDQTLLAFTVNHSRKENLKYNIYYDPVTRNHNLPFKYIGLYADKTIFAIGRLQKIVYCDYINGELVATKDGSLNQINSEEYNRIKSIIEDTSYYELEYGNKFFIVDEFYQTDFVKTSYYPLRAKKYFWLNEINGFKKGMSALEIARLLNGKTWE